MSEQIVLDPDKRYFKIGEISSITGLKPYVLRFWEGEFKQIKPDRTLSGQRVYRKSDLELILKIKTLLYEKKFTIPGAKAALRGESPAEPSQGTPDSGLSLSDIRDELQAIRSILD